MPQPLGAGESFLSHYGAAFRELAGTTYPMGAYRAGDLLDALDELKRTALSEGQAALDFTGIEMLSAKIAAFIEEIDSHHLAAEELDTTVEHIAEALDEAEAITLGNYEHNQDRLMALAAVIINLLQQPGSAPAQRLAGQVVDNFLASYGPPSPLDKDEIDQTETERLAADSGLLDSEKQETPA